MARLEDVCDKASSNIAQKDLEGNEGKYPIFGASGFIKNVDFYKQEKEYIAIVKDGAGVGRTMLLPAKSSVIGTMQYIIPKENIDTRFLCHVIEWMDLGKYCTGATIPHIYFKDYKNEKFNLPDLVEQRKIADKIEKVDELIFCRKEQLAKLDELVKARFVEMFGDQGYPENTLLNLCNIIDYRGKTPEKVECGLPFITAKNVRMHQMNLEPREYISKETYDKVMVRGFPKEGDVVFTTEAPLGNVCRIPHFDTEFYIGQRIVTMQTEKLEPIYLEYALSSDDFKRKYMEKSSGSTVTGIRVRLLEQLTILVPPMELQKRFANFVERTEKTKAEVQKSLDELETLKKSLMQKYFG